MKIWIAHLLRSRLPVCPIWSGSGGCSNMVWGICKRIFFFIWSLEKETFQVVFSVKCTFCLLLHFSSSFLKSNYYNIMNVNLLNANWIWVKSKWNWYENGGNRSSRPEVLCKKGVLWNFAKFTGKHRSSLFQYTSTNTSQHESTRINTSRHQSNMHQHESRTSQPESNVSQYEPDMSQHKSTRI